MTYCSFRMQLCLRAGGIRDLSQAAGLPVTEVAVIRPDKSPPGRGDD